MASGQSSPLAGVAVREVGVEDPGFKPGVPPNFFVFFWVGGSHSGRGCFFFSKWLSHRNPTSERRADKS